MNTDDNNTHKTTTTIYTRQLKIKRVQKGKTCTLLNQHVNEHTLNYDNNNCYYDHY